MKKLLIVGFAAMLLAACNQQKVNDSSSTAVSEQQEPEVENVEAEGTAMPEGTEIGNKYVDIELPGIQGNMVRLSDYVGKNKYTLVDFWASWCGPCRAEMPHVVRAYAEYHSKGLEVIGVSLDNDHEAWVNAIEQLNMPWPQMSDLGGWNSMGATLYKVRSIPSNVLIDQQGQIVAKDLRGNQLLQTLAELMP